MSYLVLARKYRPQRFSELVGQEHVARTLSNAIAANRVHHAFLFTGARGVGKTSAARILAKALVCEKGPTADPCGACGLCQDVAAGRSVDVIEIDAASNTKVEETKSVLEGVRYLPAQARRKIYIIDEVHMLSAHSFNALLKTLEEPPPHVVFVFATTEAHKIPVTILSRCQRFDFKLIPTTRLAEHLGGILQAEKIDATPEAVRLVARQAAGSVRDGLSLLDQAIAYVGSERLTAEVAAEVLGIADRRLLLDLAGAVLDREAAAVLRLLAAAADRGVDLSELARSFLGFLRDLEVVARVSGARGSVDPGDLVDATPEELAEAQALVARAGPGLIPVLFDRWARALDEASRSQTPRLMFEMAGVDLCTAEPMLPLGDLLQRLEAMESRLSSSSGTLKGSPRPPATDSAGQSPASSTRYSGGDREAPAPKPAPPSAPPKGGRSWASAAAAVTPPAVTPAPAAAPAASQEAQTPSELWRQVLSNLEVKRPRLGALLAHAEVAAFTPGAVTLAFPEKFSVDQAEKARGEVESAISEALGRPTRISFVVGAGSAAAAVPSAVGVETEAATADRKAREQEARQHPVIRRTQDLFGASLKEIKT